MKPVSKLPTTGGTIPAKPPAWLSKHAKATWKTTIQNLKSADRTLPLAYHESFVGYCEASAIVREASELLAKEGLVIDGGREGKKRHPAVVVHAGGLAQLRGFADALGLTCAASARLPQAVVKEESKWAKLKKRP